MNHVSETRWSGPVEIATFGCELQTPAYFSKKPSTLVWIVNGKLHVLPQKENRQRKGCQRDAEVLLSGFRARVLSALVRDGVWQGEQTVQEASVRIVHVLWDFSEKIFEVWLKTICLRRLHKAVDRGAGFGAVERIKEVSIVTATAERTDRSLTGGVIYGDVCVLDCEIPRKI